MEIFTLGTDFNVVVFGWCKMIVFISFLIIVDIHFKVTLYGLELESDGLLITLHLLDIDFIVIKMRYSINSALQGHSFTQ